ncbi:hypothetical protein CRG98_007887 [Punica granatum]|uniref:Uncharacterized protein n=1 Tax=Punica granatum TaxID=22663 RepID=A0A2I0KTF3_PUNGR|nr:hypothetical protein CRG98_007887 [Punica granatum]
MNGAGPSPLPETTSEMSNGSEEEGLARQKLSNQASHPPALPTKGCSLSAAAAPPWLLSSLAGEDLSYLFSELHTIHDHFAP